MGVKSNASAIVRAENGKIERFHGFPGNAMSFSSALLARKLQ
jgi:hypothetical protein